MRLDQKEKIHLMREKGDSYSQIAEAIGVSVNTVKSYCRRNNLNNASEKEEIKESHQDCKCCGKELIQGTKGQPKKFCSEECRRKWWKKNDSKLTKKAFYTLTCKGCNKKFESYGNKNRKFCGHACYINSRFKREGELNDKSRV